jgi:hypothetical protein
MTSGQNGGKRNRILVNFTIESCPVILHIICVFVIFTFGRDARQNSKPVPPVAVREL